MHRSRLLLATLALPALLAAATGRTFEAGVELAVLPDVVPETSGLTEGSLDDGVLFTHNDSTQLPYDPNAVNVFATTHAGELVATIELEGVGGTDIEDIAWGPGPDGEPALYLADIGDNFEVRPQVWLYVFPEPVLDPTLRDTTVTLTPDDITTVTLTYPDGPHNAETVLVHPQTGEVTIVTKTSDGVSGIYTTPRPTRPGPAALTRRGTLDFNPIWTQESHNPEFDDSQYLATGGDISHDGSWVVVRTYTEAFEWPLGPDGDVADAVQAQPLVVTIPPESQGEAITYEHGDDALLTSSENTRLMHRMALATSAADPAQPDAAPSPELPVTGSGTVPALAGVLLLATLTRRRVWTRPPPAAASAPCEP